MRVLRAIALLLCVGLARPAMAADAGNAAEKVVQYALEHVVSGTPVTEIVGGTRISVRPLRTWKSVSGFYCRRYEITVAPPEAAPERKRQVRCRDRDAIWKLVRKR